MSDDFLETIWAQYAVETEEHIESIESLLVKADAGELSADEVSGLFRAFHSLKGLSRVMELGALEAIAHRCEDLLGLVRDGTLRRHGAALALAGHEATLQGTEKLIWERLKPWLDEGGFLPPRLSDLLERDRSLRKDQVLRTLQRLQRMGKVHPVGAEYWFQTEQMLALSLRAKALADADPNQRLNVRDLRESVGVSRHLSVPLVEYFDEIGLTERDAVGRHFKRDPRKMFGG